MDIEMLTMFFLWCTILNLWLLMLSFLVVTNGPCGDFIYRIHGKWFPMPRETFNAVLYFILGLYKILVFVFNLVPWVALVIIH